VNLEGLMEKRRGKKSVWYESVDGEIIAKQCSKCRKVKSLDDYRIQKSGLGGKTSICQVCDNERNRIYRESKRPKDKPRRPFYTLDVVRKVFAEADCVLISEEYVDANTPLNYLCNCGRNSKISFYDFRLGKRCRECGNKKIGIKRRHAYDYVKGFFEDAGCLLLSERYVDANTPLDYVCSCGNDSKISFYDFQTGGRCRKCYLEKLVGETNPNYNPDITDEERMEGRNYSEYREWRNCVFERDSYTCRCCEDVGGRLAAHHLDGYNWATDRRTDVSNGITLCKECHNQFHDVYGRGNNTKEQFIEWVETNRQRFYQDQKRFDRLIEWLDKANGMTVEEYRDYVYECHANPNEINDNVAN
jgi:hypothetical protein